MDASCNCGAPVVPAFKRAQEAIKDNPGMSNTQIAEKAGVDEKTVRRAKKKSTSSREEVEEDDRPTIDKPPKGNLWDDQDDRKDEDESRPAGAIQSLTYAAYVATPAWLECPAKLVRCIHFQYERTTKMARSEAVFPANRQDLYEKYGYSAAVRSGDLLFVSGQVGSRPDGSPEPDFEAQVRLAFANLEAVLAAGGCTFDDIVDVTSFHTDPEKQFGVYRTVKREKFPKAPYPNATAVGVNWLAGFDFEIKVIARIPSPA
jgi:enamine deaminase RidA (YjgF/YER057c/UK114 family)